ncbi:tRNA (N(6)-L-threonylcarbamoyladenosine(37)-C(2))- methylthiotransferase MtaB [Clostridia bacterium]|nr:tRNA (N(6)-L-threonylcarbamoyladenosine(37)-C(2))- methylthiotransferase MtaB [Clostridia bacterium]
MTQTTVSIATLGCKVNHQESEKLADDFNGLGFTIVEQNEPADICIINSCTVTSMADAKTRQRIRQARSKNPDAFVCVIGCMPEVSHDAVSAMEEVNLILGSAEKERTAALIVRQLAMTRKELSPTTTATAAAPRYGGRTRAFLKAEDGCDRYCAYCIIPYARGPVRSKPADEIVSEATGLLSSGYREIILTGINLARYGADFIAQAESDSLPLYKLLKQLTDLDRAREYRIRLGSLEPTVISAGEAHAIAALPRICPQFHLSLQSGSDRTLKAMERRYTAEDYLDIISALREIDPNFAVTTDVIVGFPGETDEDFSESLAFVERAGFAKVHIFPYSAREGTRAANLPGQIPESIKKARAAAMQEAGNRSAKSYLDGHIGQSRRTLALGPDKTGALRGLTDNGIDVRIPQKAYDFPHNEFFDLILTPEIVRKFE